MAQLSEWQYSAAIEPSGAVLYGITHDTEVFAEKVGLIRSYAELRAESGSTFVPFNLGEEGMAPDAEVQTAELPSKSPDYHYAISRRLFAPFRISDFAESGQSLRGEQVFAFTETSSTPRHETVGVAAAGRFYPALNFSTGPVGDPTEEAIETLRFDFWIQPDLASGGRRTPSLLLPTLEATLGTGLALLENVNFEEITPQQAGLFRDRDHSLAHRLWTVGGIGRPGEQVFEGAEKPLKWEIAGDGISRGRTSETWDNIHVWGHSRSGLVSTPGMPYGMHLHWRWSAALTNNISLALLGDFTPDFLRAPELAGRDLAGDMVPGGPLIDPRNPDTDLRIAVVSMATAEAYSAKVAATPEEFESLFEGIAARPGVIEKGTDMVVIISVVVRRPDRRSTWKGTVFPHGLFFPHAYDIGFAAEAALTASGAYQPQYLPSAPTRRWHRNPK